MRKGTREEEKESEHWEGGRQGTRLEEYVRRDARESLCSHFRVMSRGRVLRS
jgi:hypothetical protein